MLRYKIIEIFTSEDVKWRGQSIYSAIVDYINSLKIAARTIVTRGIEGSYESGEIATGRVEVLSYNMPVRIAIILPAHELDHVLSTIQEMVTDGIVALRDQDVIFHRTSGVLMSKHTLVREIMTASPKKVEITTPMSEVAELLLSSTFTGVPVVDEMNRPVGVIAQGDLIYKAEMPIRLGLLAGSDRSKTDEVLKVLASRKAGEIMSRPAVVIDQDQPVTEAVNLMLARNVKRLPVVDGEGKLAGILSRLDVFHTILRECPDWRAFQNKNIQVENLKLVSDIVRRDSFTVLPETPVDEVIRLIDCTDIERVCVVDKEGLFLGLISDRDLLIAFVDRHPGIWDYLMSRMPFTERGRRYRELKEHLQARTASEVMKTDVITIREDAALEEAIHLMLDRVIKRLPVVDAKGLFKGMISRDSLLRAGFASSARSRPAV
jgi:CBS domain-containing protein